MKNIFVTIAVLIAMCGISCLMARPVHAQEYSSGIYTLVCKTSGLALDNEGSTTAGSVLVQNPAQQNDVDQQWSSKEPE